VSSVALTAGTSADPHDATKANQALMVRLPAQAVLNFMHAASLSFKNTLLEFYIFKKILLKNIT